MITQECPVCGRPLKIRREYLGRVLTCGHCHGRLLVDVSTEHGGAEPRIGDGLMRRADQLLGQIAGLKGVGFLQSWTGG